MSFYAQFAPHYEQIFPFRPATLDFLRARLPERGRVLDLGCGPGHYAGALGAGGLEAIGLDLDPAMIEAARARYSQALFAVADVGEVATICERADGAFCIGNVLPHLSPDRRDAFLRDLAALMPAGAPWLVQTVNFDRFLPLAGPYDFPPLDAGGGLVFRRRYLPGADSTVICFLTALARDGATVFEGEVALWPVTSGDLAAVHAGAGFSLVDEWGGFAGEAFEPAKSGACVQVYRRA
ncbi:MAG TPA: class I SAM-dependent methyltransferase [Candidatus Krumholzibacteria bacterium]|nr:class I SAM-dependent methyltransferase [Candidatus Krumholzibacteria bacterium]HPD70350.1 class I SAM-dependent methyltransferase [Candidatus Krumholzibacteria bacterium]HRY39950.1 class I SAM-dependent methyltransferase [Candidatus Krumholzibacteria bacterium]